MSDTRRAPPRGVFGFVCTSIGSAEASIWEERGRGVIGFREPRTSGAAPVADCRLSKCYVPVLARLARVDVLIIDDWGHAPLKDQDRRDLIEVLDDRYGLRSTVMTSQLPTTKWHDHIGDPTSADAICDRVLHNAHRLVLKRPSRRKEEPVKTEN